MRSVQKVVTSRRKVVARPAMPWCGTACDWPAACAMAGRPGWKDRTKDVTVFDLQKE
jgi:hypothetical protein